MYTKEEWRIPGRIAGKALVYGKTLLKEGASVREITEKVEVFIEKQGGKCGFPVNISLNDMAAHYTAIPDDKTILQKGDLVKLDIGVHVNGCIGDNARTVEIGTKNKQHLIKAADEALKAAQDCLKIGREVGEIGKVIEDTVTSRGLQPIRNLSGHSIDRWIVHSGLIVPNYNNKNKTKLEKGMVIAIEPFVTEGAGEVKEGKSSQIYRLYNKKSVRDATTKNVLSYIEEEFHTLPFSKRMLMKQFNAFQTTVALNNLKKEGIIYDYGTLPEKSGSPVAQAEHSFFIDDEITVLTDPSDD